jgi:bacterioferritin-associated ferredoxin
VAGIEITRCLCKGIAFEQLLPSARREGWSLDELMRRTGCGTGCGLCRPYLRRMLATGETVFRELLWEEPPR